MSRITQPCLLCDKPVEVEQESWEQFEAPAALCPYCRPFVTLQIIPWPQVQMIYVLRCQVADLYAKVQVQEQHLARLYAAQKELEQEFLALTKAGARSV